MNRSHKTLWRRIMIGALTLPLLSSSCADIANRALINGFYNATIPVLDDQFEQQLAECLADQQET